MYDKKPPTPSTSSSSEKSIVPADRHVRATLTELVDSDEEEDRERKEPIASTSAIPSN